MAYDGNITADIPNLEAMEAYLQQLIQNWRVFFKFWIAQSVLILIINIMCLFIIVAVHRQKTKQYSTLFLMGVMVSHILHGFSLIMWEAYISRRDAFIDVFIDSMALMLVFLALIAFDRILAIKYALYYHTLTIRYPMFALSIALIPFVGFVLLIYISSTKPDGRDYNIVGVLSLGIMSVIICIIIMVSNFVVYKEAKRQLKNIASTTVSSNQKNQEMALQRIRKKKIKALTICLLLTLSFTFFWLPHFIYVFLKFSKVYLKHDYWIHMGTWFFGGFNAIADPIIYEYFSRDVRRYMLKTFCKSRNRYSQNMTNSNVSKMTVECQF